MHIDNSRFTPNGSNLLKMAEEIAVQYKINYVGVEHLLMAICLDSITESKFRLLFGFNAFAVFDLLVKEYDLKNDLEKIKNPSTQTRSAHRFVQATPRLMLTIGFAEKILADLKQPFINEDALFLGIIKKTNSDNMSDAAKVLDSLGYDYDVLLPILSAASH